MKYQPRRSAPHYNIPALQADAPWSLGTLQASPQKYRGNPKDTETMGAVKSSSSLS